MPKGQLFVVAAPSGAGKTSLIKALIKQNAMIQVSVSHTTRQIRPGETDQTDYHFVGKPAFHALEARQGFLESAKVFGHLYGTSLDAVENALAEGRHLILEIDWQGAAQVRAKLPESRSIFILPPSRDALLSRLRGRRQDRASTIANRMAAASREMSHYDEFDYLIVNDDFATACRQMEDIILRADSRYLLAHQSPRLSRLLQKIID